MREYYKNPENRRIKKVRDNDRNAYKRKLGISHMPVGKHLDHIGWKFAKKPYSTTTVTVVISAKKNLAKAAKTTNNMKKKLIKKSSKK